MMIRPLVNNELTRNLFRAIIIRAIRDIVSYRHSNKLRHKRLYTDAYNWMFYDIPIDDLDVFMSYKNVCEFIDIDYNRLRRIVNKLNKDLFDQLNKNGNILVELSNVHNRRNKSNGTNISTNSVNLPKRKIKISKFNRAI